MNMATEDDETESGQSAAGTATSEETGAQGARRESDGAVSDSVPMEDDSDSPDAARVDAAPQPGPDESAGAPADDVDSGSAAAGDTGTGDGYATETIKRILEAALLVAGRPLAIGDFEKLFGGSTEAPPRNAIRGALAELAADWSGRSLALQEVASGWRAQVRTEFEPWIARLWDEKPPRYSRALLETLAIIAYRQPMTRSEIEDIRGVSVSSQIIRTLTEREWIRVVGHREAPGRPAMYGTTREFLDYFNLKTLDQLPPISDIKDLEGQYPELGFEAEPASGSGTPDSATAPPGAHDEDGAETEPTDDREPADASADGAETNTSGTDDSAGAAPSMQGVDDAPTTDVDALSSTDDDAGEDDEEDEDDAEDSSCTPAS
jgi:segregation and condensation protein B